ncbi:unnamed protein product [Heterobilharzia americana]|nr:unnamed protein product [Heterobilharzia americana]
MKLNATSLQHWETFSIESLNGLKKQPKPHLGNSLTDIKDDLRYYNFCEEYDICHDFSCLDEEDTEKGEDRETRHETKRQNHVE